MWLGSSARQPSSSRPPWGSGVIIDKKGIVITNNHVVHGADTITVTFFDQNKYPAKIMGMDKLSDMAVLKIIAEKGKTFPSVRLGNSDSLNIGELTIAIGNPFGYDHTVTMGIISAKGRMPGLTTFENFIQTDAAINPGNSGGALLNVKGELIGINTAIASRSGGYNGIGFAIPINMARQIADEIINYGRVTRSWLGVELQDVNQELQKALKLPSAQGAMINEILENSPAEKAKLQPGDVILSLNNQPIEDAGHLNNLVAHFSPKSGIILKMWRKGKEETVKVVLEERTLDAESIPLSSKDNRFAITVRTMTKELAEKFDYKNRKGVLVAEVGTGSEAAEKGIRPGDLIEEVDGKLIPSVKKYDEIQVAIKPGNAAVIRIRRGNANKYIALKAK